MSKDLSELRDIFGQFIVQLDKTNNRDNKRESVRKYREEYIKLTLERKPHLLKDQAYFLNQVLDGVELQPSRIKPHLKICKTSKDFDIFDYFQLWSSFPTRDRPGRRFKFLLFDVGQRKQTIMAIGCISSCLRQCKARDDWIGWYEPEFYKTRKLNLAYMMDLSTCVGIPPYSFLTSGKLLCYLILSKEFREAYVERYQNQYSSKLKRKITDIALFVTSGAFSSNTPQYKGINVNGLNRFKFVGYTKGYSTFHIPQSLYNILLEELDLPELELTRFKDGGANAKLRMLRKISRILGVDEEKVVFSGHKRSIFVAPLAINWREFLLEQEIKLDYYDDRFEQLFQEWRNKWLIRRLNTQHVQQKINDFRTNEFSIFKITAQS